MKDICQPIYEKGITDITNCKKRTTVRGIIIRNDQVLMVYSPQFDDYTFAGGGKKEDEALEDTLVRELKEELGADYVYDINPYGKLVEYRYGLNQNKQVYEQTSYYFICRVGSLGRQDLAEREIGHGVVPTWVNISEAINHNEKVMSDANHTKEGMQTVMVRENVVLRKILDEFTRYFKVVSAYKDKSINIPKRATKLSAGYDIEAAEDVIINPFEVKLIPTGLKVHLLKDEALFIYPRSSLAIKHSLTMPNSVGVIDADYYDNKSNEGHILISMYNFGKEAVSIKKGERIAQGIFQKYLTAINDDASNNRDGGFGSTDLQWNSIYKLEGF